MPTLTERIRDLESLPEDTRDAAIWSEFKRSASNSEIVKSIVNGETTFEKEYLNAFGRYRSGAVFLPYSPPSSLPRTEALEACIGESPLKESYLAWLENPVGMAGMFGFGGWLLSLAGWRSAQKEQPSRRDFIIAAILFFGAFGGAGGFALSYQTLQELEKLRQNAVNLDRMFSEVSAKHGGNSHPTSPP